MFGWLWLCLGCLWLVVLWSFLLVPLPLGVGSLAVLWWFSVLIFLHSLPPSPLPPTPPSPFRGRGAGGSCARRAVAPPAASGGYGAVGPRRAAPRGHPSPLPPAPPSPTGGGGLAVLYNKRRGSGRCGAAGARRRVARAPTRKAMLLARPARRRPPARVRPAPPRAACCPCSGAPPPCARGLARPPLARAARPRYSPPRRSRRGFARFARPRGGRAGGRRGPRPSGSAPPGRLWPPAGPSARAGFLTVPSVSVCRLQKVGARLEPRAIFLTWAIASPPRVSATAYCRPSHRPAASNR